MTEFDWVGEGVPADDGLEGTVVEEVEEEDAPPDPGFTVIKDRYGRGTEGVYFNGEAVGLWLQREHPSLPGEEVQRLLAGMGLDEARAAWFGGWRSSALEASERLKEDPALQGMALTEERSRERLDLVRAAFLKAQREKR